MLNKGLMNAGSALEPVQTDTHILYLVCYIEETNSYVL